MNKKIIGIGLLVIMSCINQESTVPIVKKDNTNKIIIVEDIYKEDTIDIEYLTINGESDSTIIGEWCFTDTCNCNICIVHN